MKKIIDTILRWRLELKRLKQGGELKASEWGTLHKLRGD